MPHRAENARWQKCGRSAKACQGLCRHGPELKSISIARLKRFDGGEGNVVLTDPEMKSISITRLKPLASLRARATRRVLK